MLLGSFEFSGDGGEYIEVSDANGKTVADAIRLTKTAPPPPVSFTTYTVHPDHLGTAHRLTDQTGQVVWSASYDPFGRASVNEDPDGDGNTVSFDARFPGQYYDSETGLHYNYFRYYDPSTGRYLSYDPMGLHAGLNPYTYVFNNPLAYTDPLGLYTDARWKSGPSFSGVSRRSLGEMDAFEYWTIIPPAVGLGGEWFMLSGNISGVVECIDKDKCGEEKSDTFNINLSLGKKVGIGWGFTSAPLLQSGRQVARAFSNIGDAVEFYNNEWTQLGINMANNPMTWCIVAQAMGSASGGDISLSADFY